MRCPLLCRSRGTLDGSLASSRGSASFARPHPSGAELPYRILSFVASSPLSVCSCRTLGARGVTVLVSFPFSQTWVTGDPGVNISGSTRRDLNLARQIFEMGRIDNRTALVSAASTLWRPEQLCKVTPRPPQPGPVYRVLTASLGMCAHGMGSR